MHDNEKILDALKQVLDYELKAINHLKSFSYGKADKSNTEAYIEIKKRIAEELKEAELLIRQIFVAEYAIKCSTLKSTGHDSVRKHRSAKGSAGLTK
jgi:bacterioferritin (cytochrome b1)